MKTTFTLCFDRSRSTFYAWRFGNYIFRPDANASGIFCHFVPSLEVKKARFRRCDRIWPFTRRYIIHCISFLEIFQVTSCYESLSSLRWEFLSGQSLLHSETNRTITTVAYLKHLSISAYLKHLSISAWSLYCSFS